MRSCSTWSLIALSFAAHDPNPSIRALESPQMRDEYMLVCQLESAMPACSALLAGFPRESAFPAKIDALSRLEPT
jgi:hypothetical protein